MKINKINILFLGCICLMSCNNHKNDFDATGSFEATEIIVSAEANGKIMSLNIAEGQKLQLSENVGYIDTTQLYLQKISLLSNMKGVRAQRPNINTQTAAIEEQITKLKHERQRTQKLIEANAATQKQLDDINSQINILNKQFSAQTSTLQNSNATITAQSSAMEIQVAQIEDMILKSVIKSPISGVVLSKYMQTSELAATGTPIFKIADVDNMQLRAYLTSNQLSQIKLNDTVTVNVDAGNGDMKSYKGKIIWISDKSEFTPKTIQTKNERANLVYAIKIAVSNDGFLKIGMYGEVKFKNR